MSESIVITFLYFLGSLLNAFVLVTCYNNITNRKKINMYDWLVMLVIAIIMVANNLYNEYNIAMIFSIILALIQMRFKKNLEAWKAEIAAETTIEIAAEVTTEAAAETKVEAEQAE